MSLLLYSREPVSFTILTMASGVIDSSSGRVRVFTISTFLAGAVREKMILLMSIIFTGITGFTERTEVVNVGGSHRSSAVVTIASHCMMHLIGHLKDRGATMLDDELRR